MKKIITVSIIGFGGRGSLFGQLMQSHGGYEIKAVCDIDAKQRKKCQQMLHLGPDQLFDTEEAFFSEKRSDVLVIATWDKNHVRQCVRAMEMGYHVLLEKPISGSREELDTLLKAQEKTGRQVVVCHELRYGPGFEKISELLASGIIGQLVAIDAMERVAYWHQAQAYVRLQAKAPGMTYPTILAKCCHDLDLIQHYAGSACATVSSIGSLGFFRAENMPSGATERCLDCPHVETCPYSAKKIYIDRWHQQGCPEYVWPYNKVSLSIPTTEEKLYEGLKTGELGKCAFQCHVESDPGVVDHQLVQMQFQNGVTAVLKMVYAAESGRRINLFGTHGELLLDERTDTIEIRPYGGETQIVPIGSLVENGSSHGGGDSRIVDGFYALLNGSRENRTSLKESVESHLIGISAEESRHQGGICVQVHQ